MAKAPKQARKKALKKPGKAVKDLEARTDKADEVKGGFHDMAKNVIQNIRA